MGTEQLTNKFEDVFIKDEGSEERKKKKRRNTTGRLKKIGFDHHDLDRQFMPTLNREGFAPIAAQQLGSINVECNDRAVNTELPLMKNFSDELRLEDKVWNNMKLFGYTDPLPVQQVCIPYLVNYTNDMMISASTGSGKTYAFILPIIDYIIRAKSQFPDMSLNTKSPYALVVAPTRELAIQLAMETERLVKGSYRVKVAFSVGDMVHQQKDNNLKEGCDILFLTVGRLYSYFVDRRDFGVTRLKTDNLKFIVIDEADRVIDDRKRRRNEGSELPPSSEILKQFIVDDLSVAQGRKDFRVILLSATLNTNNDLLLSLVMPSLIKIQVGTKYVASTVRQDFVEIIDDGTRDVKIHEFMEIFTCLAERYNDDYDPTSLPPDKTHWRMGRTIIFVNNKRESDRINMSLTKKNFLTAAINGSLSGRQRYENFDNLIKGRIDILVATDLMSRGVNVNKLDFVFNYDFPTGLSADEYMHRVGRCGRIGNTGRSITLFNPRFDCRAAPDLIEGCKAIGRPIPEVLLRCVQTKNFNGSGSPRQMRQSKSTTVFNERNGQRYPSGGSSSSSDTLKNGYQSAY